MKQDGLVSANDPSPPAHSARWVQYSAIALVLIAALIAIVVFKKRRLIPPQIDPQPSLHSGHHGSGAKQPEAALSVLVGVNTTSAPGTAPEGMVWIPGGTFWMGCDDCEMPDAEPLHLVTVDGFWMDATPVTNAEFARFVRATDYLTIAERKPDPKDYPDVDPSKLVAGSAVFESPAKDVPLDDITQWWHYVAGASWKHPEGARTTVDGLEQHPVVHIAWKDAVAYAKWAGKRLPTEAEFEFAARGGLDRNRYAWGDDLKPGGKWAANIWQGRFPSNNLAEDGYLGTSPVTAFPANGFGLYDVGGNVWQWCADWYRSDYFSMLAANGVTVNPQGPTDSYDPQEPAIQKRVQKGGSFLCSDRYCSRYLVGSRGRGAIDSGGSNTGFRCVKSP